MDAVLAGVLVKSLCIDLIFVVAGFVVKKPNSSD
jgi:hypothetical protein